MPTRNIALTDTQDRFVGELVKRGVYQSASEVLREGLRLLEDRMTQREAELANIRNGVMEGLRQADAGEFIDGDLEDVIAGAFDKAGLQRRS